jgi:hypothetical protein
MLVNAMVSARVAPSRAAVGTSVTCRVSNDAAIASKALSVLASTLPAMK